LRTSASNLAGMKVSDAPWERFQPYLIEGLDVFVGPESLIQQGLGAGAVGAVSALATAFPELVLEAVRSGSGDATQRVGELRAAIPMLSADVTTTGPKTRRAGFAFVHPSDRPSASAYCRPGGLRPTRAPCSAHRGD